MRATPSRLSALLLCAAPASATTWIVDDDGGAGVDFTTIGAAVAVAAPGDVILVRPGSYGGFALASGVQVLGAAGVVVTGNVTIANVGPGPRAVLASLSTRAIEVSQCAAAVLLEDLTVAATTADVVALGAQSSIFVAASSDVRLRAVTATAPGSTGHVFSALRSDASRVEVTHSTLVGCAGRFGTFFTNGSDGGDGIRVDDGNGPSTVHVALSTVRGGEGGGYSGDGQCPFCGAGDGGIGIRIGGDVSSVLVTGVATDVVRGGQPGLGNTCSQDGFPGHAMFVPASATARISGATIEGATFACGGAHVAAVGGQGLVTEPMPADPTLALAGTIAPGRIVTFTVRGAPGAAARLRLGRQLVVQDLRESYEDRLTVALRTYDLGALPSTGSATFAFTLPPSLPKGSAVVAQASVVTPGDVALTQSVPITLR